MTSHAHIAMAPDVEFVVQREQSNFHFGWNIISRPTCSNVENVVLMPIIIHPNRGIISKISCVRVL